MSDFVPGALVLPHEHCRVAHIIGSIGSGGGWWYALCSRPGRLPTNGMSSARIVPDGSPVCAKCATRAARTLCAGCGHTAPCVCTGCPCAVSDGREGS